jgi:hypothetical protein
MILFFEPPSDNSSTGTLRVDSADWLHTALPLALPVRRDDGETRRYRMQICGFEISADSVESLGQRASHLLSGLVNISRLPDYVFVARRSGGIYPVYTIGRVVMATTPGGPVFRHVELAKVREYLSDYLHRGGILGSPGRSEKLHVRGVDPRTLTLKRPVFYLKKRVAGEDEFWSPVFLSDDGRQIQTYAANQMQEAAVEGGKEVFVLRELAAKALIADGRLGHSDWLQAERLFPETWEQVRQHLIPEPHGLQTENGVIPLYRAAHLLIALLHRPDEDRYDLYLGQDQEQLLDRIQRNFSRRSMTNAVPA